MYFRVVSGVVDATNVLKYTISQSVIQSLRQTADSQLMSRMVSASIEATSVDNYSQSYCQALSTDINTYRDHPRLDTDN